MAFFETLLHLLLILPVSFFIATVFVLAALGKSLGFRKKYVEFLLYIFEVRALSLNSQIRNLRWYLYARDGRNLLDSLTSICTRP